MNSYWMPDTMLGAQASWEINYFHVFQEIGGKQFDNTWIETF
jgi:hypothetical protein